MKIKICEKYPENRLFCLDLLRGIDMMLLLCFGAITHAINRAVEGGLPKALMNQITHASWEGFHLWDIIMPLFIFMCGAAVPFALTKRLKDGKFTLDYWRHVEIRFVVLWILGMCVQGNLSTYSAKYINYFSNTLQTIAIGYLIAALILPIKSRIIRLIPAIGVFIIYALLLHFGGDYSMSGNLAMKVDKAVFSLIVPETHSMMTESKYAWILPSFMYAGMTLFGMESAKLLVDNTISKWRRANILTIAALTFLALGYLLSFIIPVIKPIFTPSFTLLAIGWSMLSLAILFILTDILNFRYGMSIPILFGQYALFAYVTAHIFGGIYYSLSAFFTNGISHLPESGLKLYMSKEWVEVIRRIIAIGAMTYILAIRRALEKLK
jgi:predicted acyltransferase